MESTATAVSLDPAAPVDPAALAAFSFHVWNYKQGQMVSLMIQLGDRLGLYRSARWRRPAERRRARGAHRACTSAGCSKWLRGQAAAKLLDLSLRVAVSS